MDKLLIQFVGNIMIGEKNDALLSNCSDNCESVQAQSTSSGSEGDVGWIVDVLKWACMEPWVYGAGSCFTRYIYGWPDIGKCPDLINFKLR